MILVTGGAGYIGSHTVVEMLAANLDLVILDNFSNSSPKVIDAIERIAGKRPLVVEGDVRDNALLHRIFDDYPIDGVIHFAGLKAVGESVEQPMRYYENNVRGVSGAVSGDGRGRSVSAGLQFLGNRLW